MSAIIGGVSGFFFDIAKGLLKDLIKSAIENKIKKITEEQIKDALIEHLKHLQPANQTNVNIGIKIDTLDVLLQEVYSVAKASNGIAVYDGRIEIKSPSLIKPPDIIREKRLNNKIKRMKTMIESAVKKEEEFDEEQKSSLETASSAEPICDLTPPDRPLMFPALTPTPQVKIEQNDIEKAVSKYKNKIQTSIKEEEGD